MVRKSNDDPVKPARRPNNAAGGKARQPPAKARREPGAAKPAVAKGVRARAAADAVAAAGALPRWSATETREAFRRFSAASPEPKGELAFANPFTLLVAVVLSAQATDASVNKATAPIFAAVDTPEKMVAFGEDRLREAIQSIGLFRMKAKNVIALAQKLLAEHGGKVPADREALERLPGVGRKTANVVLNTAFGEPTIAVDTHVFRVCNRTGLAPGISPLEVEAGLEAAVPPEYKLHAHHWLILHGRYVCKAQRPLCEQCLINDLCRWPGKVTPAGAPGAAVVAAGDSG